MVRKTVTLVFCDVADSTPLGERLDPEALRDVWSRYHATARAVLERHGGTIEKFVGDAIMGVFGIPVVHEDDAVRAVRAAVELREAMAERTCRTITIVGDPGVGKSRLAGELVSSLGDEALALEGRCLPYGSGITYWPLVEIVRRLDLEALLAGEADGDVIRGRILEAIGRAEPRSRSDELYWAVRRLLE